MPREVFRLRNGAVLVADRFVASTAAVVVAVGVGSLYEEAGKRGVTHLLEHMLFRLPGFDVDEAVESLGGTNNAYTQRDALFIAFEGISESAAGLAELAYRLYSNEKYAEEDLKKEKDAVLSELRQTREDPSERAGELALRALFGDSDWGAPVGGTPETVEELTLADLLEHKRAWFTPGNTVVVLSGGFGKDAVDMTANLFGKLEGRAPSKKTPSKGRGPRLIEERRDVDGVYYSLAVEVAAGDAAAAHILLYGASFHLEAGTKSILFNLVRNSGVAYSYYVDYDAVGDTAYLAVVVESARSLEEARRAVEEALKPRSPPGYRLRFFEYLWRSSWRSPLNRALTLAEYVFKGGDPLRLEQAIEDAVKAGTAWLEGRLVQRGEAAVVPG
ncbi:MAG: pitrilysin family protein [Pyrobaculum sp.]|uniref:M16 family metallopeptidase n=1 Tax=Pyrobaculum sp. TaxID=2004705 RepID=UPI003EEBC675